MTVPRVVALLAIGLLCHELRAQCEVSQVSGTLSVGDRDFGTSVSLDSDVLVVGDFVSPGVAYVFRRDAEAWALEQELEAPEPDAEFGCSVAVHGDVAVVGAPRSSAIEFNRGAAHVYRYGCAAWSYQTCLLASDGDWGDKFGESVAIHGDVIVVGARDDENEGVFQSGSAYVFRWNGVAWVEEAKLTDPKPEESALFGFAVAVHGSWALVGAHSSDDGGTLTGAAFLFEGRGGTWRFHTKLSGHDITGPAQFGRSVSLAEGVAVIGAPSVGGGDGAGYVYRWDGKAWWHEKTLLPTAGDGGFGNSIAISENAATILVGAPGDPEAGFGAGAAYSFFHDGSTWRSGTKFIASDTGAGDGLGRSTAVSGDVGFVGAIDAGLGNDGLAYEFGGLSFTDCNANGNPDTCDILSGSSGDDDGDGIPDECVGDLDGDGDVDFADLLVVLASWGPCGEPCPPCKGDLDEDCAIGFQDLLVVLSNWDPA
jgi:hypothetical protein